MLISRRSLRQNAPDASRVSFPPCAPHPSHNQSYLILLCLKFRETKFTVVVRPLPDCSCTEAATTPLSRVSISYLLYAAGSWTHLRCNGILRNTCTVVHISNKLELNTYVHICSRIHFEVHINICVELTYIYVDVSTSKYTLIFVLNGQTGWTCTRRKLDKPCRTDSTSRI